jgi:hypothetical protein
VPELVETSNDKDDARIRLLVCNTCKSVEPLPFYEGPVEYDDTLNHRVSAHRFPDGSEHFGSLMKVSETSWENPTKQAEILKQLALQSKKPGQGEGLGDDMYECRSTYSEDAMSCWRFEHGRTSNCADYKSDKKRLVYQQTLAERKAAGLEHRSKHVPTNTYLCDFCPYKSVVQQRVMKDKGIG